MDEKEAEALPVMGTIFLVYLLCMIKVGLGGVLEVCGECYNIG